MRLLKDQSSSSSLTHEELSALVQELERILTQRASLVASVIARAAARNSTLRAAALSQLTYGFATEANLSARQTHPGYPSQPLLRPLRVGDPVTVLNCVIVDGQISNNSNDYIGTIIRIERDDLVVQTRTNLLLRRLHNFLAYRDE